MRFNRKWFNCLVFSFVFFFLPLSAFSASSVGPRMKEYFKDAFLPHLWAGTKTTFGDPKNWAYLGVGGALAVVAHQYEGPVNDYWKDHELQYGLADVGNDWWGSGLVPAGMAASMMFIGWQTDNARTADTGEVLAEALILQGLVITVIKPIANKERPDRSDNQSFPSGHSGSAFVTAAVLQDRLGWKVGLPAYGLAVLTGFARMDVQAHWLSDVVMGAGIGTVIGYAVSHAHDDYPYDIRRPKPGLTLAPILERDRWGLYLMASW